MSTESLIDADIASADWRERLKGVARLALQLAEAAAEGKSDYFIASQISLLTRNFSRVVSPPELGSVLDFLGMSIQAEVGRAHKPQGPPAHKAVEPVHETKLKAHV